MSMEDGYDVLTALKDVDRALPEAGKLIRKYIETLKARAPQPKDENEEQES